MRQFSLIVLLACQPNETSSFRDAQFAQSSPCWAVSLEDGINSTNANEFVALFDCINQSDAFTEFVPLVDYWSITSPDEPNQAMRLASIFNSLSELDYQFSDLFLATYTLIHEYQSLYTSLESIVVELIYGQSRYSPPDSLTSELSINTGLVNSALQFNRELTLGKRLDIPSGTAIRFEPGQTKEVDIIEYSGKREVYGFNGHVNGKVTKV